MSRELKSCLTQELQFVLYKFNMYLNMTLERFKRDGDVLIKFCVNCV
jgi:hypothetical protein